MSKIVNNVPQAGQSPYGAAPPRPVTREGWPENWYTQRERGPQVIRELEQPPPAPKPVPEFPTVTFQTRPNPYCCGIVDIGNFSWEQERWSGSDLVREVAHLRRLSMSACDLNGVAILTATTTQDANGLLEGILRATAGWTLVRTFTSRGTGRVVSFWMFHNNEL